MRFGAIYIAHNPRDGANTFKVGMTERSVDERMKELTSATSNLGTYSAMAFFIVNDVAGAEKACHDRLSRYRVQQNREFFEIGFSRLLKIVRDEVNVYTAKDCYPEDAINSDNDTTSKVSARDLLSRARESRDDMDQAWEEARSRSLAIALEWRQQVCVQISAASQELSEEDLLHWEIFNCDPQDENFELRSICSVTVFSKFSEEPLLLKRSGFRGRSFHEDLDLSKAVGEVDVSKGGLDGSEYLRWVEPDDGRVGKLEISCHLSNDGASFKESGELPVPCLMVSGNAIKYDDYHSNFKAGYRIRIDFTDPEEAIEHFLHLVVENIKVKQEDVRQEGLYRQSRDGSPRISDRGKFICELTDESE